MDKKSRLDERIERMRTLINLNESEIIPLDAEEVPDDEATTVVSELKELLKGVDSILHKQGALIINTLTHAMVASDIQKYKALKSQLDTVHNKLKQEHNRFFDTIENLEQTQDVSNLESLVNQLDDKTGMIDELTEIMDEMLNRVIRFNHYYPHLLSLNNHNIN